MVSGEWYVGEVHSLREDGEILVSLQSRCLGRGKNGVGDYYGITHWFERDENGEWVYSSYDTEAIGN